MLLFLTVYITVYHVNLTIERNLNSLSAPSIAIVLLLKGILGYTICVVIKRLYKL